ncbi:MAG TPA: hypothetical protein VIK32_11745, partial [Candidatus Limnocylindrales bacterium]
MRVAHRLDDDVVTILRSERRDDVGAVEIADFLLLPATGIEDLQVDAVLQRSSCPGRTRSETEWPALSNAHPYSVPMTPAPNTRIFIS